MRRLLVVGTTAILALTAVACGDDADDATAPTATGSAAVTSGPATTSAAPTTEAPATTAPATSAPVTTAPATTAPSDTPTQIVSLSPTHTEILFAIGAGDQVIAVDDQSNFPEEAETVASDLSGFEPNVEAIAGYEPDLVVIADDFTGLTDQLESLDIPVWSGPSPATFDDVYGQIEQLGSTTGHVDEAAELVEQMQADIDAIVADAPVFEEAPSFYHELDDTYYSVTSSTFIGQVYGLFGLRNIADDARGAGGGFPQLNAEFIISADPELIFLAGTKCCRVSARTVAERDGWASISAVVRDRVIELDDDVASRWGPRLVDFVDVIGEAIG